MIHPNGIRRPQGSELRIVQTEDGLFTIVNAYEGDYEYFKDRPITTLTPTSAAKRTQLDSAELSKVTGVLVER